jgi:hypothetical protein
LVQEIGPRSVGVACFKPSRYADVNYAKLSQFSRDCRAPGNAGSIGCSTAAAAAWCKAGKADELGLAQEIGPASIGVACFHGFTQVMDIYNPQQL